MGEAKDQFHSIQNTTDGREIYIYQQKDALLSSHK